MTKKTCKMIYPDGFGAVHNGRGGYKNCVRAWLTPGSHAYGVNKVFIKTVAVYFSIITFWPAPLFSVMM
jgi:hypothetical protein